MHPKFTRVVLSYYVTSGLSAALGLFLISAGVRWWEGSFAAAAASIGAIVVIPPDQPAPRRGKFWQLFPSVLFSVPLFYAVRRLHADPLPFGLLLVPATFLAFLGAAWGRRGLPLSMSAMFAIVFAMAVPGGADAALSSTLYFALGAVSYAVFATAANAALNGCYRVQMLADTLLSMAALMRIQARQFAFDPGSSAAPANPLGELIRGQAALADQVQTARDILLESPRTHRRRQLAGMLLLTLEIRDQLLACELDLELVTASSSQAGQLDALRYALNAHALQLEELADHLMRGRRPPPFVEMGSRPGEAPEDPTVSTVLARGMAARVRNISVELHRLLALARDEAEPQVAVVRASWKMFVSTTQWSWLPLETVWHWDAPPLRHAIRAALAIGTAYAISLSMPWGTHAYWILLTIVVVLRGSFAQTLERRNSRVAGTLLGSALAGSLLSAHPPVLLVMAIVTLAQGVAHAFAVRRYIVTAVSATILALLQVHLLNADLNPAFEALERVADTLIGALVAWAFSYVLPAWERRQIPALVARARAAQARHAVLCLAQGQLEADGDKPELQWRLARREAYDSLSALVQATQRSLSEPRAVRPPLEVLSRLLAHSYQLLAQLTAIKTLLLLRRGHLDGAKLKAPLQAAVDEIDEILAQPTSDDTHPLPSPLGDANPMLPDPFGRDVTPWVLRRLRLATDLAIRVAGDARRIEAVSVAQNAK